MENFNINTITIFISVITSAFVLFDKIVFTFSTFHSKHRIKELDEQIEIAKKHGLHLNKNLIDMLESGIFQSIFGFWINHWKIKLYTDYYYKNQLTPIMLKLLYKLGYLLIDNTNKVLVTQISKMHKIKFYLNTTLAIIFCLMFTASIVYAIFTPSEPNIFLQLVNVSLGILFIVLSGIIFTHYVSPYRWAVNIQKKNPK